MKKKKLSLKSKIIIAIILSALFLCFLVIVMLSTYLGKVLVENKLKEIEKLNIEQVQNNINIFKNDQTFTKMLGSRTRVKEYLLNPTEDRRVELLEIFSEYAKDDSKYLSLYLLDKNGRAIISTDPSFVGQDYSFRDYYKNGMLGISHTDLLLGKTSNQFGYYFSYPVFNDNKNVIGVFVSKISNEDIDNSIYNSQITLDSTLMLVDKNGIIVTSTRKDRFLKSLGHLTEEEKQSLSISNKFIGREIIPLQYDMAQQVVRDGEINKILEFKNKEDGEIKILDISKIGEFPFYLVSETGMEGVRSTVYRIIIILIGLITVSVFIACFFIYSLIIKALSPLSKLKKLAGNIAFGDFSQKIEIGTNDELGDLARTFNKMSDDLNDLYKNLDKKVKEKTKDLELKSKELSSQKVAILNILEDIKKEKDKTEEVSQRLELATKSAKIGVWEWDVVNNILTWDDQMYELYGINKKDFSGAYDAWQNGLHPDDRQAGDLAIKKALSGEKEFNIIFRVLWPNKDIRYIQAYAIIERDSAGKPLKMIGVNFDITHEQEVDRAKTEFVSLASHQLRTPLSSINWYTEMLLAGDAGEINEEQKKYLTEVAVGNQRMVDLVDSLLNVSRLDLGTFIIEPEPIDVVDTSKSIIKELSPLIKEKKLKFKDKYSDIPPFNADRKLFRMIFQNLISNAVKYTPSGKEIKVSVEVKNTGDIFGHKELKEDSLVIFVKDTGIGVPDGQKEKIFSKMFRADNARESETEGTGLGLYIIKSIIDKSGGEIWFESKENEGTTFYVSLPKDGMVKKDGTKKLD